MNRIDELICHVPATAAARVLRELRRHPLLAGRRPVSASVATTYYDTTQARLQQGGWRVCAQHSRRKRQVAVSHLVDTGLGMRALRWWSAPWPMARALGPQGAPDAAAPDSQFAAPLERLLESSPDLPRGARQMLAAQQPLTELCTVQMQRTCWRVDYAGLLVDVVLERGRVETGIEKTLASGTEQGKRAVPFCLLRIVACAPAAALSAPQRSHAWVAADLLAFAQALQQTLLLRPAWADDTVIEYLQIQDENSGNGTDGAPAQQHAPGAGWAPVRASAIELDGAKKPRDALALICRSVARHWLANEAGASRTDDSEYIHQLRVALRRLKTALKIFRRWVEPASTAQLVAELDWFAGLLGAVRDWDVFVETTLPPLLAAGAAGALWQPLRAQAEAKRRAAREEVKAALDSRRYACLTLALLHWTAKLALPAPSERESLRDYARATLRRHTRRLRRAPDLTTLDEHERHRQRIHVKRLRYALEFFGSFLTAKTRSRMLRQVAKIQDILGVGNDAVVALQLAGQLQPEPQAQEFTRGFMNGWFGAIKARSASVAQGRLRKLAKPALAGRH